MQKPLIAVTMGDAAGIGPELCLSILSDPAVTDICCPVVYGHADLLRRVARQSGITFPVETIELAAAPAAGYQGPSAIINCCTVDASSVVAGKVDGSCGAAAYAAIEAASSDVMAGGMAAMVTAPLNKSSLHLAGIEHPGHTEILASLCGTHRVCMMLESQRITVSLATVHVDYKQVTELLTTRRIVEVINLTHQAIGRLRAKIPRITVCGLNPHASDDGLFGDEESRIIEPAIVEAQQAGINISGPLPPDTAFLPSCLETTDAYVVMYHDQGLIPFKMLSFETGVNITLGLPIIRTSVDHGTAFDIAWQGVASASSLVAAIQRAVQLLP